ncbi:hypothetical protein ACOMHN_004887 [Nucella lapillus]
MPKGKKRNNTPGSSREASHDESCEEAPRINDEHGDSSFAKFKSEAESLDLQGKDKVDFIERRLQTEHQREKRQWEIEREERQSQIEREERQSQIEREERQSQIEREERQSQIEREERQSQIERERE